MGCQLWRIIFYKEIKTLYSNTDTEYSMDGQPAQVVDLTCGEHIPEDVLAALDDPAVTKWAFNASFERICLSRYLGLPSGTYFDPSQWRCSMIWSAYLGLPLSLAGVGAVLKLEKQKLETGRDLIRYFCKPCAPTKRNGERNGANFSVRRS